jgi:hypothetical protein
MLIEYLTHKVICFVKTNQINRLFVYSPVGICLYWILLPEFCLSDHHTQVQCITHLSATPDVCHTGVTLKNNEL